MKTIYILHEGNEKNTYDNQLIRALIKNLHLDNYLDLVEFVGMGTKSNFFKIENYPQLLKEGVKIGDVEKVLFIVDSDCFENDNQYGGYENTEKELNNIIALLGFQKVSSIYIMHDPTTPYRTGYLESFLLSTIPENRMQCIRDFLVCSGFIAKEGDKSIYQRIYKSIADPFHPYRFEHPHFTELKNTLQNLFYTDTSMN